MMLMHYGASLRLVALLLMGLVVLAPYPANSADPTKALFGCLKSAHDELIVPLMPDGKPQPAQTGVLALCEGPSAKVLFDALELIADQKWTRTGSHVGPTQALNAPALPVRLRAMSALLGSAWVAHSSTL